ncbi:MAG: flagellar protein FlbB, partial [Spirochaetaceae bacterium]|nr:flagellar protein FlbB [Spirochaetaceae bacterium]
MARVLLLLLLIAVVSAGGLLWFDYLDVIDIKTVLSPVYKLVGREGRSQPDIPADEPINLDSERLAVRLEAEAMRSLELDKLTEEINSRQAELTQLASELDDRQKALDEREQTKTAEEESDAVKNRNTDQIAEYLNNQAPDNAVPILLAMDDQL